MNLMQFNNYVNDEYSALVASDFTDCTTYTKAQAWLKEHPIKDPSPVLFSLLHPNAELCRMIRWLRDNLPASTPFCTDGIGRYTAIVSGVTSPSILTKGPKRYDL
jgi:hypothetical protein